MGNVNEIVFRTYSHTTAVAGFQVLENWDKNTKLLSNKLYSSLFR